MTSANRQGAAQTVPEPAARSPERQALAEAIERAAAQRAACEQVQAASKRAGDMVSAAYRDLSTAEEAVTAAKTAVRDSITAAAMGGEAVQGDDALRAARLAEIAAKDRLDVLREAMESIVSPVGGLNDVLVDREAAVERAAVVVMATAVEGIVTAMEPLKRALTAHALALRALGSLAGVAVHGETADALRRAQTLSNAILQLSTFDREASSMYALSNEWEMARRQLRSDPDFPLPAPPASSPV